MCYLLSSQNYNFLFGFKSVDGEGEEGKGGGEGGERMCVHLCVRQGSCWWDLVI